MKHSKQIFKPLPEHIAAIDLGSNSFHMLVAKHEDDNLIVMDQLKESVRLGAGLGNDNRISDDAVTRALECLARFGQRIQHIPAHGIRIVGTNTMRRAANSTELLEKAQKILGHRIEIISGVEEARLIYLGVSHHVAEDKGRRMVVDIGGGSTEITLGDRFDPVFIHSFEMGCVIMSHKIFSDGIITKKRIRLAILTAKVELEPYIQQYKKLKWDDVIGASGTIKSVASVVSSMGWCPSGISAESLEQLVNEFKKLSHIDEIKFKGLKSERQSIFIGGVLVLKAIFDTFDINHMQVSKGALREGILYDLIGRENHEDTRSKTIHNWSERYQIDQIHGKEVAKTSLDLFTQLAEAWHIDDDEWQRQLFWAANIHEIGLSISHSQFHKHGAYILQNADLLGFSQEDQLILSILVRAQRGKLSPDLFELLDKSWQDKAIKIALLLRIAIILNRSRDYHARMMPSIDVTNHKITLVFPDDFPETHPLTCADLLKEQSLIKQSGISLILSFVENE